MIYQLEVYANGLIKDCKEDRVIVDVISPTRNVRLLNFAELLYCDVLILKNEKYRNVFICSDFPLLCKYKNQYLFVSKKDIPLDTDRQISIINKLIDISLHKKWFINPINLITLNIIQIPNYENKYVITDINFNYYLISNNLKDIKISIYNIDDNLDRKNINYTDQIKLI